MRLQIFAILVVALGPISSARAQQWSHVVSYRHAASASLKVTEPENFKVTIVAGGETKSDTIPAIFNLANQDAFVPLTVTASDGQTWSVKIEVRARQQTEVKIKYTPAQRAEPAKAGGQKFIGRAANSTHRCSDRRQVGTLRFDFLLGGANARSVEVPPNRVVNNIELEGGTYSVRVFIKRTPQDAYIFVRTGSLAVNRDGWEFSWGCGR
jgi:hypothetical protein